MNVLKSLIEHLGSHALYDLFILVFKWIVLPILLIVLIQASWLFFILDKTALVIGIAIGLLISLLVVVTLYLALRNRFKASEEDEFLNADFEVIEQEQIYRHFSKHRMVYIKRKKLRVVRDNLDRAVEKYSWSGEGKMEIRLKDPGQEIVHLRKKNVWNALEVKFDRVLARDEEVEFEIIFELEDYSKKAIPVLDATIVEPTKFLSMRIILPDGEAEETVTKHIYQSFLAKKPLQTTHDLLRHNEYNWVVEGPTIGHCYELQWNWKT